MFWENIQGFFNFDNLYSRMVALSKDDSIFVEIGSWKGKSTVYMAEEIKKSGKNIKFYTIDTFEGTREEHDLESDIIHHSLYETYLKNIDPIKDFITTIRGSSWEMHKEFKENSIDFLFIDGDHTYEGVKKDLSLWFPKVKKGGIISGHDYTEPTCGVKMAVDEFFLFTGIIIDRSSWIFKTDCLNGFVSNDKTYI
jgi:predicted O-methyltransferase YrrM